MGVTLSNGVYVPDIRERGWGAKVNTALTKLNGLLSAGLKAVATGWVTQDPATSLYHAWYLTGAGGFSEVTGADPVSAHAVPGTDAAACFNLLFATHPGIVGYAQDLRTLFPIVAKSKCGIAGAGNWIKSASFGPTIILDAAWSPGAQNPFGIVIAGGVDGFNIHRVNVNAAAAETLVTPCTNALAGTGARVRVSGSGFTGGSLSVVKSNGSEWNFSDETQIRATSNGQIAYEHGTSSDCRFHGGFISGGQSDHPSVLIGGGEDYQMSGDVHIVKSAGLGPIMRVKSGFSGYSNLLLDSIGSPTGGGAGAQGQVEIISPDGTNLFSDIILRNNANGQNVPAFYASGASAVAVIGGTTIIKSFGTSYSKIAQAATGAMLVFRGALLADIEGAVGAGLDATDLATAFGMSGGALIDYDDLRVYRKDGGSWSRMVANLLDGGTP